MGASIKPSQSSFEVVAQIAAQLPGTEEGTFFGNRAWKVAKRAYAWDRPLRTADLESFDGPPPAGPILGVAAGDLGERDAVVSAHPQCCFSIPHFAKHPAFLVDLDNTPAGVLSELLTDAWLVFAPEELASQVAEPPSL